MSRVIARGKLTAKKDGIEGPPTTSRLLGRSVTPRLDRHSQVTTKVTPKLVFRDSKKRSGLEGLHPPARDSLFRHACERACVLPLGRSLPPLRGPHAGLWCARIEGRGLPPLRRP
jgi:hypothetical protein